MIRLPHPCLGLLSFALLVTSVHKVPASDDPVVENPVLAIKYDPANNRQPIEEQLQSVLGQPSTLKFQNLPLVDLVRLLRQHSGMPIFIDELSFKASHIDPMIQLHADVAGSSLKGILFAALSPHGLEAIVENDMLMFTTNFDSLARMGAKTTQWISVDDAATEALIDKLGQIYSANFRQIPLEEAIQQIASEQDIPMVINTRALEDVGLTRDVPVTLNAKGITTLSFLQIMMKENDLALNVHEGMLEVTTDEDASSEDKMLLRSYWMDGTDFQQPEKAAEVIVQTISPANWESVGGPSTIKPFHGPSGRSALVISTGFTDHLQIENLLNSFKGLPNRPAKIAPVDSPHSEPVGRPAPPVIRPANAADPFQRPVDPFGGPPVNPFGDR